MDKLLVINYTLSQYFHKDIRIKEYNGTIEADDILITLENPPKRFKSEFNEISCFLQFFIKIKPHCFSLRMNFYKL